MAYFMSGGIDNDVRLTDLPYPSVNFWSEFLPPIAYRGTIISGAAIDYQ